MGIMSTGYCSLKSSLPLIPYWRYRARLVVLVRDPKYHHYLAFYVSADGY
jgi:hypothetical protein